MLSPLSEDDFGRSGGRLLALKAHYRNRVFRMKISLICFEDQGALAY